MYAILHVRLDKDKDVRYNVRIGGGYYVEHEHYEF